MRVIALTGGIASGKTTVARMLERHGGVLLDADEVSREVVRPGTPALGAIEEAFGPRVIDADGCLDRQALARIVFGDDAARRRLNEIVHPAVRAAFTQELDRLRALPRAPRLVVLVVPLLFETGMEQMADEAWLVSVPIDVQRERLMRRDGLSAPEAMARIHAQWPLERKIALSQRVITNDGSLADVEHQVTEALAAAGLL